MTVGRLPRPPANSPRNRQRHSRFRPSKLTRFATRFQDRRRARVWDSAWWVPGRHAPPRRPVCSCAPSPSPPPRSREGSRTTCKGAVRFSGTPTIVVVLRGVSCAEAKRVLARVRPRDAAAPVALRARARAVRPDRRPHRRPLVRLGRGPGRPAQAAARVRRHGRRLDLAAPRLQNRLAPRQARRLRDDASWARRCRVAVAVVAAVVGIGAGSVHPTAAPPPGAQISASLEYVTRVPGTGQVVEGKFDKAGGRELLILTGRFGFKTLDVSDPTNPVRARHASSRPRSSARTATGRTRTWTSTSRRNLIIGALDPRHDNVDQASCPGIGASAREDPRTRSAAPAST